MDKLETRLKNIDNRVRDVVKEIKAIRREEVNKLAKSNNELYVELSTALDNSWESLLSIRGVSDGTFKR